MEKVVRHADAAIGPPPAMVAMAVEPSVSALVDLVLLRGGDRSTTIHLQKSSEIE
jgi:hypothetical protein